MIQDLTTTSILKLFQTTKEERQSFALDLIEKLNSGFVDPLEVHLQVKCMEELVKSLTSNQEYKELVLNSAEKNGKSFQFHNAKVEIKEVGVKYDFSKCNDPILTELNEKITQLSKELKDRETMLKTVQSSGLTILNEDTGETFTVYPPSKSSSTSVAITLK